MAELPSGTVTFLFTDIEGSTRLLQRLGDRYAEVLVEHHKLLRAAFQKVGGQEIDTQGDAFFVVFRRASDAVAATVAAQRAIAAHPWPEGTPVRVRMGLHTGEPILTTAGYIGLDVHRAARICSAGHGGQVLLSQTTRTLLGEDLPKGVSLRDLGKHRLKDLTTPEQIFQLVVSELPAEFPPLKTLNILPNNLPIQLTTFIGREREMVGIKQLLSTTHLLTLTGSGGCGKTRLALQVAADLLEEYPDGVWLVELAAISDPALVPQTVASALGICEQPGLPLLTLLTDHLQPKQLLLVLDNCEHLIEVSAHLVESLLHACPNLRILVTSRELLSVAGEVAWRVPPLSLPDPRAIPATESLTQYEAIRLFLERAAAALPTFTLTNQNARAVVQICQRLDGVPLAVELAAARVKVLSVEQIAMRLDDRFRLLTGGSRTALRRQQTLQATIDWSYKLLAEKERALLRRLSVFAGGCTLGAAEAVCADGEVNDSEILDLLSQLVDKSLVLKEEQGREARYRLLETIRQYGQERLIEAGEAVALRERHLDFFLKIAEQAQPQLEGPEAGVWLQQLEAERDNLRTALEWSKKGEGASHAGLRLAGALWRFWEVHGYFSEGRKWLEDMLAESGSVSAPWRAQAFYGAGSLALNQGDFERARALLSESLALYRGLGNKQGIASALNSLGKAAWDQGNHAEARSLYEESLAIRRELGDKVGIATLLRNLGSVARNQGDSASARTLFEESLAIFREVGSQRGIAFALGNLGIITAEQGNPGAARTLFEECLAIFRELGDKRGTAFALNNLGNVAWKQGNSAAARSLFEESLEIKRELGDKWGIANSLINLGNAAKSQGDLVSARSLYEESLAVWHQLGHKQGIADSLVALAGVAVAQEHLRRAAKLFGAAEALRHIFDLPLSPSERAEYDRTLAAARAGLGEEAFATAWDEGQAMTLEQIIAYALEKGSA